MRLFALNGSAELGRAVAISAGVDLSAHEERDFENGEHKARPIQSVRNEDVYILQSLAGSDGVSPAERLVRLLFFIGCCRDNGAARVTAVTPYLAYMRKDQQTKSRDPINSRYVVQLLEAMGADMIVTLDPHNKSAFQNAVRVSSVVLDTRALFAARIVELGDKRDLVFMSPDSGAMKRTHLLRESFEALTGRKAGLAFIEKHRSDDVVSGSLFAGDVDGKDIIIVDDMISSGGTLLRAAEACKARGAGQVHAFAAHLLDISGSGALYSSPNIHTVFVTDSVASPSRAVEAIPKLEVISCAPLLAEAIQRLHGHGSINRLLNPQA